MFDTDGDPVGFGMGHPHPRSYGTFPRVLGRYVREMKVEYRRVELGHWLRRVNDAGVVERTVEPAEAFDRLPLKSSKSPLAEVIVASNRLLRVV